MTTILLSQPVAALQVLGKDNIWRYVKYKHGGMVVNLGEVLEFISGGLLPATRHRGAFGSHGDQAGTDVQ